MRSNWIGKLYKCFILAVIFVLTGMFTASPAKAQKDDKEALTKMIGEDRSTIDAIAGCDEKVQDNILQLAQTPEVLDIIQDLQKKSEKKFKDIIVPYDRDTQAALYDLARYPDLITELVKNGKPTQSEVNDIVLNYPVDIHETAKKYARSCYDALRQIDGLNDEIDRDFRTDLAPYDDQTRACVNVLLKYPEIVSVLVDDKDFTRLLGEVYREDPKWVTDQIDKISAELDEQNKKDVSDYQKQIENDPEAYNEMLSAADKFAEENNISREEDAYVDPDADVALISCYPFWFGYPYWYPYAYWRPYPAYYFTGFYFGPNRNIIFVGLPSSHFIYWQTHYHPNLYPHLSYFYYDYYHNHYLPYQNQRQRPVSNYAFYRSVQRNIINNPRVNNETLVRIDQRRGNNIVRQPNISQPSTFGRGTETSTRQYTTQSNSVKRDVFPRVTPSDITPGTSYGLRRANPNQSSPGRINGGKSGIQLRQNRAQVNTPQLRNYRNYRATQPRQVDPAPIRRGSVPSKIASSRGRGQTSFTMRSRAHASIGRYSRNSKRR